MTEPRRGISLPLLVFRHRIKNVTDAAWHALCAQEYAKRWWESLPESELPATLSEYPGDRRSPFGAFNVTPAQFIEASERAGAVHIENALVAVVGTFEAYMSDLIGRCVRLRPDLLADSEMSLQIKDFVVSEFLDSPVNWIASEYVQKQVRNKSHSKLILRFGSMIKRDIARAEPSLFDDWEKRVLLRNSLVHVGGLVSADLSSAWAERFPSEKARIEVTPSDIVSYHKVAYELAQAIDRFAVNRVIKQHDSELLARELFVVTGESDPRVLSAAVANLLGGQFTKQMAESALAFQRKSHVDPHAEYAIRSEWLHRPHNAK